MCSSNDGGGLCPLCGTHTKLCLLMPIREAVDLPDAVFPSSLLRFIAFLKKVSTSHELEVVGKQEDLDTSACIACITLLNTCMLFCKRRTMNEHHWDPPDDSSSTNININTSSSDSVQLRSTPSPVRSPVQRLSSQSISFGALDSRISSSNSEPRLNFSAQNFGFDSDDLKRICSTYNASCSSNKAEKQTIIIGSNKVHNSPVTSPNPSTQPVSMSVSPLMSSSPLPLPASLQKSGVQPQSLQSSMPLNDEHQEAFMYSLNLISKSPPPLPQSPAPSSPLTRSRCRTPDLKLQDSIGSQTSQAQVASPSSSPKIRPQDSPKISPQNSPKNSPERRSPRISPQVVRNLSEFPSVSDNSLDTVSLLSVFNNTKIVTTHNINRTPKKFFNFRSMSKTEQSGEGEKTSISSLLSSENAVTRSPLASPSQDDSSKELDSSLKKSKLAVNQLGDHGTPQTKLVLKEFKSKKATPVMNNLHISLLNMFNSTNNVINQPSVSSDCNASDFRAECMSDNNPNVQQESKHDAPLVAKSILKKSKLFSLGAKKKVSKYVHFKESHSCKYFKNSSMMLFEECPASHSSEEDEEKEVLLEQLQVLPMKSNTSNEETKEVSVTMEEELPESERAEQTSSSMSPNSNKKSQCVDQLREFHKKKRSKDLDISAEQIKDLQQTLACSENPYKVPSPSKANTGKHKINTIPKKTQFNICNFILTNEEKNCNDYIEKEHNIKKRKSIQESPSDRKGQKGHIKSTSKLESLKAKEKCQNDSKHIGPTKEKSISIVNSMSQALAGSLCTELEHKRDSVGSVSSKPKSEINEVESNSLNCVKYKKSIGRPRKLSLHLNSVSNQNNKIVTNEEASLIEPLAATRLENLSQATVEVNPNQVNDNSQVSCATPPQTRTKPWQPVYFAKDICKSNLKIRSELLIEAQKRMMSCYVKLERCDAITPSNSNHISSLDHKKTVKKVKRKSNDPKPCPKQKKIRSYEMRS